jgi:hypothetical protein
MRLIGRFAVRVEENFLETRLISLSHTCFRLNDFAGVLSCSGFEIQRRK